jgi:two-component system sensor histidine kinase CpxA
VDEHGFSEGEAVARVTESARASYADKPGQLEYPCHDFNELADRLQQHAGAQKQYLGDISHELRAPISRIKILLECARQSPQQICSYLARIEENVLRMQALTKSLLEFSRLELIEESPAKEPCDLAELVSLVVEDARIEAEARGCIIKHSPIPSCLVSANYELLHRAVENVVRNSVQYTRENSSVSVVLSYASNRVAQILVEDEGPGISEEELKEIFKPFYRAAHAHANGTFGAGLGLAISERAVKLHRGNINACNRSDGKGLQVAIQIPLLNKSQTSAGPLGHNSANWKATEASQASSSKP